MYVAVLVYGDEAFLLQPLDNCSPLVVVTVVRHTGVDTGVDIGQSSEIIEEGREAQRIQSAVSVRNDRLCLDYTLLFRCSGVLRLRFGYLPFTGERHAGNLDLVCRVLACGGLYGGGFDAMRYHVV